MQEELTKEMYFELVDKLNLRDPVQWNVYMTKGNTFDSAPHGRAFCQTAKSVKPWFCWELAAFVLRLYKEHCVPKTGGFTVVVDESIPEDMIFATWRGVHPGDGPCTAGFSIDSVSLATNEKQKEYTLSTALDEYKAQYELNPSILLMERNSAFRLAAEKLAAKLLHAMMKEGVDRLVYRRERQSLVLFSAACFLLKQAGVVFWCGVDSCCLRV